MRSQASSRSALHLVAAIVLRRALADGQLQLHSWMRVVHQIIDAVYVYDVDVIVVAPSAGPRFGNEKRVAAIFKSRPAPHDYGVPDVKSVFLSEIGLVLVVWNSTVLWRGLLLLVLLCLPGRCFLFLGSRLLLFRRFGLSLC